MSAASFAGAAAAYAAAAFLYYRGRFRGALAAAAAFAALVAPAVCAGMGPVAAAVALVLLLAAPLGYVLVHIVDARRGIFLLPTIYAIPLAFLAGAALLLATGLALLL
jgi:hypothetical protein